MLSPTSCSCAAESGKDNCHTTVSNGNTFGGISFSLSNVYSDLHARHVEHPSFELLREEIETSHSPCASPLSAARNGEEIAVYARTTVKHCSWCSEKTNNGESRNALNEQSASLSLSLPCKLDATFPQYESVVNSELELDDICTENINRKSTCILPSPDNRVVSPLLRPSHAIVPPPESTSVSILKPAQMITSIAVEQKPQNHFFSCVTEGPLLQADTEKEPARLEEKYEQLEENGPVPLPGLESLSLGIERSADHVNFDRCLPPRSKVHRKSSMQIKGEERIEDTPQLSFFQESRTLIPHSKKGLLFFGEQCVNSEKGTSPTVFSSSEYRLAHSCPQNKQNATFSSLNRTEKGTRETSTTSATLRSRDCAELGEIDTSESKRWNITFSELSQKRERIVENENYIFQKDELKATTTTNECTILQEESAHCPLPTISLTSPIVTTSPTSSISSTSSFSTINSLASREKRFPLSELVARLPLAPEELEEMERRDNIKKNRQTCHNIHSSNLTSKEKVNSKTETSKDCVSNVGSAEGTLRNFSERNKNRLHQFLSFKKLKAHLYKALLPVSPSFVSPTDSTEKVLACPLKKCKGIQFGPFRPPNDLADVLHECNFLGMSDIIDSVSGSSSLSKCVRGITAAMIDNEKKSDTEQKEALVSPNTALVSNFEITKQEGVKIPEGVVSTVFPCSESDKCAKVIAMCSSLSLSKEIMKAPTTNSMVEAPSPNLHSSRLTPTQAFFLAAALTEKELHERSKKISLGSENSGAREKVNFMIAEEEADLPRHTDVLSFTQTTISSLLSPVTYYGEGTVSFSPFIPSAKKQSESNPFSLCPDLDPLEHKVISDSPQSFPLRRNSSCESSSICVISSSGERYGTIESVNKCTPRLWNSTESYTTRLTSSHSGGTLQNLLYTPEGKRGENPNVNEWVTSNTHASKCRSTHSQLGNIVYVLRRGGATSLYCRSFYDEMYRVKDLKRYAAKAEEISQDCSRRSQTELIT